MEGKQQYLQFIQDVIKRHNDNSFRVKQMTMIFIGAIYGVYIASKSIYVLFISLVATTLFCLLDVFYLKQERQYRMLFEMAVLDKVGLYNMNARSYKVSFLEIFKSFSIQFYLFLITMQVLIIVVICLKK